MLAGTAGARAVGLGIVTALDDQARRPSARGVMCSGQRCIASTASEGPSATCPSASMIRMHHLTECLLKIAGCRARPSSNCFENVQRPTPIAMKYGDRRWTWREHIREASARAAALLALVDRDRPVHVGVLHGQYTRVPQSDGSRRPRRVCALRAQHHAARCGAGRRRAQGRLPGRGDRRGAPAAAGRRRPRGRPGGRRVQRGLGAHA